MQKTHVKVAVTGAAGQIGYALLFRIASGQMFGPDTEIDLHLLELEASLTRLVGTMMELEDCAFPLLRNIVCTSDVQVAMSGVNWAILVGSVPRKAGMERADLLQINGHIFAQQGRAINDYAADDVRVFVVGNPCNSNCLIAMQHAPDRSRDRFYAMTLLDQHRAMHQLARKAGVAVSDIGHMAIWGNHSATQYPDFYHATIRGKSAIAVIQDEAWLQQTFISQVQMRGTEIIKARAASSAASAAHAIISSIYYLTHDTPEGKDFSVAVCSEGEYDIDPGLIFSYPCRVRCGRLTIATGREHNAFAQDKLRLTLAELRAERDTVQQLGLLAK